MVEIIKSGGDMVVDCIWRLCCVVPEDWRSSVIVPLSKGKGEITECRNYRGISLSVVEKYMQGS